MGLHRRGSLAVALFAVSVGCAGAEETPTTPTTTTTVSVDSEAQRSSPLGRLSGPEATSPPPSAKRTEESPADDASVAASLPGYRKFFSAPGRYEVMFPAPPKETEKALSDNSTLHTALSEKNNDQALSVGWQELADPIGVEAAKNATAGLIDDVKVTKIKVLGRFDGYEIVGRHQKTHTMWRSRLFYAEGRMYQVVTLGLPEGEANAFLRSFKLVSAPETRHKF